MAENAYKEAMNKPDDAADETIRDAKTILDLLKDNLNSWK